VPLGDSVIGYAAGERSSAVIVEIRASKTGKIDICDRDTTELYVHHIESLRLELESQPFRQLQVLEEGEIGSADRLSTVQASSGAIER